MRRFLTSAAMGILSMLCVNLTAVFTGVMIPISGLSVTVSALLSVPGVAAMLVINNLII